MEHGFKKIEWTRMLLTDGKDWKRCHCKGHILLIPD